MYLSVMKKAHNAKIKTVLKKLDFIYNIYFYLFILLFDCFSVVLQWGKKKFKKKNGKNLYYNFFLLALIASKNIFTLQCA